MKLSSLILGIFVATTVVFLAGFTTVLVLYLKQKSKPTTKENSSGSFSLPKPQSVGCFLDDASSIFKTADVNFTESYRGKRTSAQCYAEALVLKSPYFGIRNKEVMDDGTTYFDCYAASPTTDLKNLTKFGPSQDCVDQQGSNNLAFSLFSTPFAPQPK